MPIDEPDQPKKDPDADPLPERDPITPDPYPVTDPVPEPDGDPGREPRREPEPFPTPPEPIPEYPPDVTFSSRRGTLIASELATSCFAPGDRGENARASPAIGQIDRPFFCLFSQNVRLPT